MGMNDGVQRGRKTEEVVGGASGVMGSEAACREMLGVWDGGRVR